MHEYLNHSESKIQNGEETGKMKRRHLLVGAKGIKYIGKESNELEETEVLGVLEDSYVEYKAPTKLDNFRDLVRF